jgi:hypothetical protein
MRLNILSFSAVRLFMPSIGFVMLVIVSAEYENIGMAVLFVVLVVTIVCGAPARGRPGRVTLP